MTDALDRFFVEEVTSGDGTSSASLNLNDNPTVLLVWAANSFNRIASRHYQNTYGISAMDWRMLVMLCKEPDVPVTAASPAVGYDKGAVSRALSKLEKLGLAEAKANGTNPRSRLWHLTPAGYELHDRILRDAIERHKRTLDGFTPEEVNTFNDLLRRFRENVDNFLE
ncbi:MarR family transcriptional regulator [Rhodococcus sp. Z13]|uniref:MarR family transcriptional regulator n=1 Tax=Rhodococcus sacchari TaxID=2962047 RepID=A0ACD4DCZ7_9NOCA|nr:MarR family transcriptional regulator [Rhodococcus sp. Z13]UYP17906.1 MarR family transcriptional regulator [Rhodococcus sp. Z13]